MIARKFLGPKRIPAYVLVRIPAFVPNRIEREWSAWFFDKHVKKNSGLRQVRKELRIEPHKKGKINLISKPTYRDGLTKRGPGARNVKGATD